METLMSWEGLVIKVGGELMLLISLDGAGSELMECSRGISKVHGEYLKIVIPEWLASMLRIEEGDLVSVGSADGQFHIQTRSPRLVH
jgi:hypothetical protein